MAKKAKTTTKLDLAVALLYVARKLRIVDPEGKFDGGGRWYPSAAENADRFTDWIRSPSRNWPYSYMLAARTRKHIKELAVVNPEFVLDAAHAAAQRHGGPDFQAARDAFLAAPASQVVVALPAPGATPGTEPPAVAA